MKLNSWSELENYRFSFGFCSIKRAQTLEQLGLLTIWRGTNRIQIDSAAVEKAEEIASGAEHLARVLGYKEGRGRVCIPLQRAALVATAHPASRLAKLARAERDARQLALPLCGSGL